MALLETLTDNKN